MKKNKFFSFGIAALLTEEVSIFAVRGHDGHDPWVAEYAIGDPGPGGGKVFYASEAGFISNGAICHYLEAAPADMDSDIAWASSGYGSTGISGATGTAIGTGAANTAAILARDADAPAAKACADYTGGGKTDWFLPSQDELNEMWKNKALIGGSWSTYYWSSSQSNDLSAWSQYFTSGIQIDFTKYLTFGVRPVRAF